MEQAVKKTKTIFVQGAVSPEQVAGMIANHRSKTHIGAHEVFMGQVRADEINGKKVKAIVYTAYEDMANKLWQQIKDDAFAKYDLACMHMLHSLGSVPAGELSLVIFVSSAHRHDCINACREIVERIKKELPVWGKEMLEDDTSHWKQHS